MIHASELKRKMFYLIEGIEYACRDESWHQLPATILYVDPKDPINMIVEGVNAVGAKIVKPRVKSR